jgi:hypothetical protein
MGNEQRSGGKKLQADAERRFAAGKHLHRIPKPDLLVWQSLWFYFFFGV